MITTVETHMKSSSKIPKINKEYSIRVTVPGGRSACYGCEKGENKIGRKKERKDQPKKEYKNY